MHVGSKARLLQAVCWTAEVQFPTGVKTVVSSVKVSCAFTQSTIQWVPGTATPVVKQWCEYDHLPPICVKTKNGGTFISQFLMTCQSAELAMQLPPHLQRNRVKQECRLGLTGSFSAVLAFWFQRKVENSHSHSHFHGV